MQNEANQKNWLQTADWEKVAIYLALSGSLATLFFYIADIKERIAKLEVKVEYLEKK